MATLATDRTATAAAEPPEFTRRRPVEPFWNLPNTITVVRTAAVPILLLLPFFPGRTGSQVIAWCFIVAALSDLVDGWLARRGQMVTHIGKLLDPLADKLIVSTALIVMLAMGRIPLWATWMVVVIVGRELAVTGLRGIASADGHVMAAAPAGKVKALVQNFAIGALLFHEPQLGLPAHAIGMTLLGLATVLTLLSGYVYFASYFRGRNAAAAAEVASSSGSETIGSEGDSA
jgi:CDP-diacylglycerol--glycerol-3-phosphate 3-phosphatidyltransferase